MQGAAAARSACSSGRLRPFAQHTHLEAIQTDGSAPALPINAAHLDACRGTRAGDAVHQVACPARLPYGGGHCRLRAGHDGLLAAADLAHCGRSGQERRSSSIGRSGAGGSMQVSRLRGSMHRRGRTMQGRCTAHAGAAMAHMQWTSSGAGPLVAGSLHDGRPSSAAAVAVQSPCWRNTGFSVAPFQNAPPPSSPPAAATNALRRLALPHWQVVDAPPFYAWPLQ